ncbi:(2Fe-2S)-binding protein [Paracraurococcus ruber]|uniref:(2Fe-2S)-binding protein n=1 Tax=Paracraurococcus ruber TaxID=77675 RepID=UPI001F0049AF|nr:(2Fe-2S)-binding protein [Paracraurococcus ruber]
MIVCLCNALTDAQLADAVAQGATRPRDVYAACDCKAQCGTCTKMIVSMIRDTRSAALAAEGRLP